MDKSPNYYNLTRDKEPSKIAKAMLEYVDHKDRVLDMGAGALKDSKFLLEQGFEVTALDREPAVFDEVARLSNDKIHAIIQSFEDFDFPIAAYDVVYAMSSLPFVRPEEFPHVFHSIKKSLKPGGVFTGVFFGPDDDWSTDATMTFHTRQQVAELFDGFEIKKLIERMDHGQTAEGVPKTWHVFLVIAKKNY